MSSKQPRPGVRGAGLANLKQLRKLAAAQENKAAKVGARPPVATQDNQPDPRNGRANAIPKGSAVSGLTPADSALFRHAVRHVQPINARPAVRLPVQRRTEAAEVLKNRRQHAAGKPIKTLARVSDDFMPAGLAHDDTVFVRNPDGIQVIKQLQQGRWAIGATLDLHGNTLDQARERLDRFLQSCTEHAIRCVRVVHGKGYGSKESGPVLGTTLRRWLTQIEAVQAYAQCSEHEGGAGALNVLLYKNATAP